MYLIFEPFKIKIFRKWNIYHFSHSDLKWTRQDRKKKYESKKARNTSVLFMTKIELPERWRATFSASLKRGSCTSIPLTLCISFWGTSVLWSNIMYPDRRVHVYDWDSLICWVCDNVMKSCLRFGCFMLWVSLIACGFDCCFLY